MINMIRMDLHRMIRSTTFYAMLVAVCMVTITSVEAVKTSREQYEDDPVAYEQMYLQQQEEQGEVIGIGVDLDSMDVVSDEFSISKYIGSIYSGNTTAFILMILMTIFICAEYETGYIKNTVNITRHRWYNIVSKITIGTVCMLIFNVIIFAISAIGLKCYAGVDKLQISADTFKYLATHLVLQIALCALFAAIATIIRGKAGSFVLGIMISMGMLSMLLTYLLGKYLHISDKILSNIFTTRKIMTIVPNSANGVYLSGIIVGAIMIIVYGIIGSVVISKRDI